jgi:hypothetical protein
MGRVYESTQGNFPPRIRFTSQDEVFPKGTWFVGTKVGEKLGKAFKKDDGMEVANKIFTFIVHDTSEGLRIDKRKNKEWQPFPLEANGTAELAGNSQLDDKIGQVPNGQMIKVTYNGKKLNEATGRKFNDYTVEDAE